MTCLSRQSADGMRGVLFGIVSVREYLKIVLSDLYRAAIPETDGDHLLRLCKRSSSKFLGHHYLPDMVRFDHFDLRAMPRDSPARTPVLLRRLS